ncbi:zincin [Pyrenochaeta sp. DS3sAY3a]|nr:zincin [Pyrenochaeta sp. DS3sAY3a]
MLICCLFVIAWLSVIGHAATFKSCSTTQIATLQIAIDRATEGAYAVVEHLTANPRGSTLQTTWFGAFNATSHSRTLAAFRKFAPDLATTFSYDCSCQSDVVVATIGGTYGDVKICSVFFNTAVVPATGFRSQWATIIHEATHFRDTLRTYDHGYGPDLCKQLAISDPARAVTNADNHACFAVAVKDATESVPRNTLRRGSRMDRH